MSIEDVGQFDERIAELTTVARDLGDQIAKAAVDGNGYAELKTQLETNTEAISAIVGERQKAEREVESQQLLDSMRDALKGVHTPSKANLVNRHFGPSDEDFRFFSTLAKARSLRYAGAISEMQEAEQELADQGLSWRQKPAESKATLGESDTAGGYLVPNNIVADLVYQGAKGNPYRSLMNVVSNLRGSAVDIPLRSISPTRAAIAAFGATKDNRAFALTNYTATLYTLAAIYDVGNQFLRQSAGAAEQLVRRELGQALTEGESYFILQGSGSSEPFGLLTAIGTSGTYVTSHTPSASTIAGNFATAIANASAALADRSRRPTGVVMNAGDFFSVLAYGDNTAGFYISPTGGAVTVDATAGFAAGRAEPALRIWGLPVYADPNMPTDSLVVGEWDAATLFFGQTYRVDVSSEAGDRWDKNITGFRAEEEMAFDGRPYVYGGFFQRITNIKA